MDELVHAYVSDNIAEMNGEKQMGTRRKSVVPSALGMCGRGVAVACDPISSSWCHVYTQRRRP